MTFYFSNRLLQRRGSVAVEFVLTIPAILALSTALLGVFLLCVKGIYVADVAQRKAAAEAVYAGSLSEDGVSVKFCSEAPLPNLIKRITGNEICHEAQFIYALPKSYLPNANNVTDSDYKCAVSEGGCI